MGTKRCNNIRASDAAIRSQDRGRAGPRLPGCREASQQPSLSLYSQWNMHNTMELGLCVCVCVCACQADYSFYRCAWYTSKLRGPL